MRGGSLLLTLAACGGAPDAPPLVAHRALADAPAASADDVIVARVDGHPVWGSCVAAQATRTGGDRAAALRDCVDFELLAWHAAARGYADDPDVVDATHTALARRMVDAFEATGPADLQPTYDKLHERALSGMRHPDFRGSTYMRIDVPPTATPDDDARAHDVAAKIAVALAGEHGLLPPDMLDIAQPIADAAGVKLAHAEVVPTLAIALVPTYADALYGIPEVGRTAGPVRTKWGWDVVLWSSVVPAANPSDAEVDAAVLPEARRQHFAFWVDRLARALHATPQLVPDAERTLENAP